VIELECPLVLLEPLAFLLGRLLEQLCARLSARALAVQELRLQLELENGWQSEEAEVKRYALLQPEGRFFKRTLHLPVPLLDARLFLKLLQLDLKAHPPGAPIVKIHLSAEPARPRAAQSGLFLPPSPEPEKLELTLARITDIVGEDKAGSLALLDTHRPEGFCMQRFAPEESHGRKSQFLQNAPDRKPKGCRNAAAKAGNVGALTTRLKPCPETNQRAADRNDSTVTALRIFRPPVRATVTLRDGQPARIACPKREPIHGEVLWVAGPWRSSGDWWEQEGWARDEWDLALQEESGIVLYRLVHDLLGGRWYVEGTYD
jgi:protein ImuB